MTRRYGDTIVVAQYHNDQPRCFIWRGTTYRVQAILARWHLRDRWWQTTSAGRAGSHGRPESAESDRQYYRLECVPELLCDLYFDAASNRWTLDCVYD